PVADVAGRWRVAREADGGGVLPDLHEAIGLAVGERLQEDRLDEAEDRRVGADAEGEGDDGDRRRGRGAEEHPQAETKVVEEGLHGGGRCKVQALVSVMISWLAGRAESREWDRASRKRDQRGGRRRRCWAMKLATSSEAGGDWGRDCDCDCGCDRGCGCGR